MYYEGLREGLRAATKVELLSMIDSLTEELVLWVERYGKAIWTMRTARIALMEDRAQEYVYNELRSNADRIVDEILAEVDWDLFFGDADDISANDFKLIPVPNPDAGTRDDDPKPHPYTKIRKEE